MKKTVSFLLVLSMMFSCILTVTTNAAVGDVVGQALHTDIVAYINHYALPSYAANGKSCIVAEDLRNFGFDVIWDGSARTLSITRNSNTTVKEMTVNKNEPSGKFFSNILETDIKVYANGQRVTSYALNGYTMIPIEDLTMFGAVYWVPEERAIKLWVDGVEQRASKQEIFGPAAKKYASTSYGSVTGMVTWQYNESIGTKPDTGADVLLVQTNHAPTADDSYSLLVFSGLLDDTIYSAEVDGSGNYYFNNIPTGEYYIMIKGKNTNESPSMQNINIASMRGYLNGKFSEEALQNLELNIKLYSFEMKKITVKPNQTERISVDWGYNFI